MPYMTESLAEFMRRNINTGQFEAFIKTVIQALIQKLLRIENKIGEKEVYNLAPDYIRVDEELREVELLEAEDRPDLFYISAFNLDEIEYHEDCFSFLAPQFFKKEKKSSSISWQIGMLTLYFCSMGDQFISIQASLTPNQIQSEVDRLRRKIKDSFIHISLEMRQFLLDCLALKHRHDLKSLLRSKWITQETSCQLSEDERESISEYLMTKLKDATQRKRVWRDVVNYLSQQLFDTQLLKLGQSGDFLSLLEINQALAQIRDGLFIELNDNSALVFRVSEIIQTVMSYRKFIYETQCENYGKCAEFKKIWSELNKRNQADLQWSGFVKMIKKCGKKKDRVQLVKEFFILTGLPLQILN